MIILRGFPFQDSEDKINIKILEEQSREAQKFDRNNLLLGFFSCVCFWAYPIFAGRRELPYGLYIPGIDIRASPVYECAYISQIVITVVGCCTYIPFSCLFTSFIKLGIVLIKILNNKLNTIGESSSFINGNSLDHNVIQQKLKESVEFHWKIIRYIDEINDLGATVCLIELVSFGILLCALLFLLITVANVPQLILAGCYVVLIMVQLYIPYWNANEVLVEVRIFRTLSASSLKNKLINNFFQSSNIGSALYNAPWYMFNVTNRRIALMIMRRTNRPLKIMIGKFYPISLQMFQSILNISYKYFTVLRGVYK